MKLTMEELMKKIEGKLPDMLNSSVKEAVTTGIKEEMEDVENKLLEKNKQTVTSPYPKVWVGGEEREVRIHEDRAKEVVEYFKALSLGDVAKMREVVGKALNEGTTTAGGYLVPDEFMAEVIRITYDYGLFRKGARTITMKTDAKKIPKMGSTGVTAHWKDEAAAKSESTPTIGEIALDVKKLTGLTAWSDELLEDSPINIIALLTDLFAEQFAYKEDLAGFQGDGTATYGSITGISSATGVNTVTLTGNAATMSNQKILDTIGSLTSSALKGAAWYCNNKFLVKYIWGLVDDNHKPIYWAPNDKPAGFLYGIPVKTTDSLPSTDAAATPFLWLGNLKNAMFGDRKKTTAKILTEATLTTAGNLAETDQAALRLVERLDIQIPYGAQFAIIKTAA